jgi:acyl-CoA reductase-like NAD-dependent aldehyde dehydrogenase
MNDRNDYFFYFILFQLFINNEFVDASNKNVFEVLNPATGDVIAEVADASEVNFF